jgi:hypothetical protein
MTGCSSSCSQCGKNNESHRLWCRHCAAPLPQEFELPQFSNPQADASREKLYQQSITDLNSLRDDLKVNDALYQTIFTFYQQQLTQIESARLDRQRTRDAHECLAKARKAGHNAQYQRGIRLVQEALAQHQTIHPWDEVLAELTAQQMESERVERLARQIEEKKQEAQRLIHEKKSELAKAKYEQAQGLEPPRLADRSASKQVVQNQPPVVVVAQPKLSASFAEQVDEPTTPAQRFIDATSKWSTVLKPFLLDNVGWFVGAFLVVAGFGILIVTFWSSIEQNQILMHSLVYASLAIATGAFFSTAYFMRLKYPELESSSNVLLVIVALLIPLVFAAAMLTSMIPSAHADRVTPVLLQTTSSDRFGQVPLQALSQTNSSNAPIVISGWSIRNKL